MRYLIIGLGIYGTNLAMDLTKMGHEVIGADINPSLVDGIKDYVSASYIIDSTDENALGMLPLKNVDLVIVAIGENFGASIRTVAILKQMGIKHIYARAIDKLHESILESFSLDRIVTPEQRAAVDLVNEMELGSDVRSMRVADDCFVISFTAPPFLQGIKFTELDMKKKYGLTLIAAARPEKSRNVLGIPHIGSKLIDTTDATLEVAVEDRLTCMGSEKAFRSLFRVING